jgi:prophage regulatory protein
MKHVTSVTSMLLKRKDVTELVGLCYTSIYNLERKGLFPARRQLSPGRVAWIRSEVEEWVRRSMVAGAEVAAEVTPEAADRSTR